MQSTAYGAALFLAAATLWLAPSASAQLAPTEVRRPDPLNPKAQVPAVSYQSAFKDYRPNAEAELGSWKDANHSVQQAGGWRAYAKEARQAELPVQALPSSAGASAPGKPAVKPAGHAHH